MEIDIKAENAAARYYHRIGYDKPPVTCCACDMVLGWQPHMIDKRAFCDACWESLLRSHFKIGQGKNR